jgi:hypothetical protein
MGQSKPGDLFQFLRRQSGARSVSVLFQRSQSSIASNGNYVLLQMPTEQNRPRGHGRSISSFSLFVESLNASISMPFFASKTGFVRALQILLERYLVDGWW